MTITKLNTINHSTKQIKLINVEFNHNEANNALINGQKQFNRTITSKQINPVIMSKILELYSQNVSISKISKIINFSRKAIKTNLDKSKNKLTTYVVWKKQKWGEIKYLKTTITYSLEKWKLNWLMNSANKTYVWTSKSEQKYQTFINWFKNFKNPLGKKLSADLLLYYWLKYIKSIDFKNVKTPTKQTIYNWIDKKKYNFNKKSFIKLSSGFYWKKKTKITTKIYNDSSKSILDLNEDTKELGINNAFEIDLVKGKISDKYSILTCLNKVTRKLYAKIVKPNAEDVKENLEKIIKENNLIIKQLIIDNGSENVLLHKIKSIQQIYRCRPYCSSDKGQIENVHRLLRYWIKKGKSIDLINQEELDQIVDYINNYPRRIYKNGKLMSANEFCSLS